VGFYIAGEGFPLSFHASSVAQVSVEDNTDGPIREKATSNEILSLTPPTGRFVERKSSGSKETEW
jgi:hypothetical protein